MHKQNRVSFRPISASQGFRSQSPLSSPKGFAHGPLSLHPWLTVPSLFTQGWRERGPWAKPLASEDAFRPWQSSLWLGSLLLINSVFVSMSQIHQLILWLNQQFGLSPHFFFKNICTNSVKYYDWWINNKLSKLWYTGYKFVCVMHASSSFWLNSCLASWMLNCNPYELPWLEE